MLKLTQDQLSMLSKEQLIDYIMMSGETSTTTAVEAPKSVKPVHKGVVKAKVNKSVEQMAKEMGVELLPDSSTHRFRMEIRSESSNKIYLVSQRKGNGVFECSCPSWIYQRGPRTEAKPCKHLRAMMPVLKEMEQNLITA